MNKEKKEARYQRLLEQLEDLLSRPAPRLSRMATLCALLSHKMDYFFWTGFYLLQNNGLFVGPYQGPLACQQLEKDKGVCWAAIRQQKTLIVPDVDAFPGHIACDSRSRSEIVIPLRNPLGHIVGVLDVDSTELNAFDEADAEYLEKMLDLAFNKA
jgi:GAF domain-containing protein